MTCSLPAPSWPHVLQVQCRSAQNRIRQPHLNPYPHNLRALTVYTRLPAVRHLAAKKTVKRGRGTVGCMAPQLQQRCLGPSGPIPGVPQCSTVAPALQAICGLGLRTLPHSRRSRLHGCGVQLLPEPHSPCSAAGQQQPPTPHAVVASLRQEQDSCRGQTGLSGGTDQACRVVTAGRSPWSTAGQLQGCPPHAPAGRLPTAPPRPWSRSSAAGRHRVTGLRLRCLAQHGKAAVCACMMAGHTALAGVQEPGKRCQGRLET